MQEIPRIIVPNAVVHPGAMMIHFEDTFIAGRAVVTPVGFVALTELAVFYFFIEGVLLVMVGRVSSV